MTPLRTECQRRQSQRNWVVFLALAGFAALVYVITIVKIKAGYGG